VLRHADAAKTEISVSEDEVIAVLDGQRLNPDRVTCELLFHPSFAAWGGALNRKLSQRDFHQLVRANRGTLGTAAEDLLLNLSQMKAVSGGEVSVHIAPTGYTQFSGRSASTEIEGSLPPEIQAMTPIFDGVEDLEVLGDDDEAPLQEYQLDILIEVEEKGGEFFFRLTDPGLDLVMRAAKRGIKTFLDHLLRDVTGAKFLVGMGTLKGDEVRRPAEGAAAE